MATNNALNNNLASGTGLPLTTGVTGTLPVANGGTGVVTSTGTGSVVLSTNPTLTGIISDKITWSDTTKGIVGTTTNNNADAGYVGEVIDSSGTVTVSSNVYTNVTSISLTAGDWDVWGNMLYANTDNTTTQFSGWISITSASYPGNTLASDLSFNSGTTMTSGQAFTVPYRRYNLSSTTTIYLTGVAIFSSGTGSIEGRINARRAR